MVWFYFYDGEYFGAHDEIITTALVTVCSTWDWIRLTTCKAGRDLTFTLSFWPFDFFYLNATSYWVPQMVCTIPHFWSISSCSHFLCSLGPLLLVKWKWGKHLVKNAPSGRSVPHSLPSSVMSKAGLNEFLAQPAVVGTMSVAFWRQPSFLPAVPTIWPWNQLFRVGRSRQDAFSIPHLSFSHIQCSQACFSSLLILFTYTNVACSSLKHSNCSASCQRASAKTLELPCSSI